MVPHAQVTRRDWDDETRGLLEPCVQASPWAILETPETLFRDCHLWEVQAGAARALVAVRGTVWPGGGRLLEVVGARSQGARFRAEQLPVIEQVAAQYEGVDLLTMCTRFPHLVRGCERAGWKAVATIVNKPLRVQ